ncbi:protein OSB3, chloroplastic/mitochondrial-like [Mercurialis annua]|uniref:protein OSB3, chloroplastic/mitochondrial-like n=1 Tax=Mercurialis annua TaxID=3986 RepID=UPI00215FFD6B|nr:protein OSB3, chloroplastic/mitochondrial-like [Mercurialis annua]
MNSVYRAVCSSRRNSALRFLSQSSSSFSSSSSSSCDWPRPKEIPFQTKVANSVHLIGYISEHIQFHADKFVATTVISQSDSPNFRIPVTFEGDLAHAAASHLKKDDHIYIAGQLTAEPLHIDVSQDQAPVRITVNSINFIEGSSQIRKSWRHKQKKEDYLPEQPAEKEPLKNFAIAEDDLKAEQSWKDLLMSPHEWWDVRSEVGNPKGAVFERKNNKELLCIDHTTPKWILEKLEAVTFDTKTTAKGGIDYMIKNGDSLLNSWRDLHENPKEWYDYRSSKLNGSVNPKHPDFKSKDGGLPLWLNMAPRWVVSKLEMVEFDAQSPKSKQVKQHKGDEYWTELVDNPNKWWDNRSNKRNVKAPDFKHKETGVGLWLTDSPAWVILKLPPLKDQNIGTTTMLS